MSNTNLLDGFQADTHKTSRVGRMTIDTIRGKVDSVEVPGFTAMLLTKHDGLSIALLSYDPDIESGVMVQITAGVARKLAKSISHLADLVDPAGIA